MVGIAKQITGQVKKRAMMAVLGVRFIKWIVPLQNGQRTAWPINELPMFKLLPQFPHVTLIMSIPLSRQKKSAAGPSPRMGQNPRQRDRSADIVHC
jgi:hypothetical protein